MLYQVLDMLPGSMRTYMAIDTPRKGIGMQVPPEYFRHDMPSGLPPYELNLKVSINFFDFFLLFSLNCYRKVL